MVENLWIAIALLCAFSLATSDALTKKVLRADNEYVVAWLRLLFSLPLLTILLIIVPAPEVDGTFYRAFILVIPCDIIAMILYIKALRVSPMSLSLPFLALTPVFLVIVSNLIVAESVSLRGGIGIALIASGGYSLNIARLKDGLFAPVKSILHERGSVYMIMVAVIFSFGASLGKLAVEHSSPVFFGAIHFIVVTLLFTPIAFINSMKGSFLKTVRREAKATILPGILFSVMILSHMTAISLTKVAYMVSIKRSSLLIGVIYGFIFFGEKNIGSRLIGASLMFAGFVLVVTG